MIRPTVARVDLDAIRTNYRAIAAYLASADRPCAGDHRRRQGQRVRARRAAGRARARGRRRRDAGLRGHRRSDRPAPGGRAGADPRVRRAERQPSRRRVRARSDARRSPRRAPRARCRPRPRPAASSCGCHLKIDTGMNRLGFRHDNLDRTLPEVAASRQPQRSTPSTRTSRPPTTRTTRSSASSGRASRRRSRVSRRLASMPAFAMPPTAPRCCATSASGTTSCVRGCCSTASCLHRSQRRSRSARRCRCTAGSSR